MQGLLDGRVPGVLLEVHDLLEVDLVGVAALARGLLDCLPVIAGRRLPIAGNPLVLTAH